MHYALQFHSGGYLIYDGWWRTTFGPGTQFPHADPGGSAFANTGAGDGIHLAKNDMAWLYNTAQINTPVVIC